MATIDETAAEVAEIVLADMGGYHQYPDLRQIALNAANNGAIRMSQRLGKSIDSEKFLEETIGFQTRAIALAQGHIQVVVLAGYAAFFALWSSMASAIPVEAMLFSGVSMTLSVTVFLSWTVVGLFFTKVATERTMEVYQNGLVDFWENFREAELKNLKGRRRLMRYWMPVVAFAGGTAFASTVALATFSGISLVTKLTSAESGVTRPVTSALQPCSRSTLISDTAKRDEAKTGKSQIAPKR